MTLKRLGFVLVLVLGLGAAAPLMAQSNQTQTVIVQQQADASDVRANFREVMSKYPPSLAKVLRYDPQLLSNQAYLAPYPILWQFLQQHPDVSHNPDYYLSWIGTENYNQQQSRPMVDMWRNLIGDMIAFSVFVVVMITLSWVVRTIIDSRRWTRVSKTQTETHTKILDRITGNEELLAYIQSPAGSKFLQSAPITIDSGPKSINAPFGRILWSVQAGIVLAAAGIGMWYISPRVDIDAQQPIFAMGVLGIALGLGFAVSAIVAYALSRRLGLIERPAAAVPERNGGPHV